MLCFFFFSSRRRHTRLQGDWSSDVCSSDLSLQVSDQLTLALGHLARREPKYLHPVVEYLILHRCFSTARNLAATLPLSTETRDTLTARITVAESPFTAEVADLPPDSPANGVMIQAPF